MALFLNMLKSQRGMSSAVGARMLSSVGTTSSLSIRFARNKPAAIQASVLDRSVKNQSTYARGLRSYPQYSIHGETAMLAMKTMLPGLKVARGDILTQDTTRKGRMLLEFIPRAADGKYVWNDVVRFGLSVEECGLLVNQLPHYKVEFSRAQQSLPQTNNMMEPDKVLTIEPGELGAVNFTIDYVLNGIGGQTPPNEGSQVIPNAGPIKVQVQAGEFEVMTCLINYTIPTLTGWSQMLDIASQNTISEALSGGGMKKPEGPMAGGGGNVSL